MSWARVPLSELSETIDYGVTASANPTSGTAKFLRITDIQENFVNWATVPFCDADAKKLRNARLVDGDIVFARTGATTGKSFLVRRPPENAVFASYLIRVRATESVAPEYLAHFFDTRDYWSQIKGMAQGAAQEGVNASKLASLQIPLPPLDEQKRIAAILDKADALRAKRRQAIALLDSLTQSIFLEMFGDPVSNPKGYPIRELQEIVDPERKITYGILMPGPDVPDGIPYVRVVDIQGGAVLTQQLRRTTKEIATVYRRSELKAGDLLISIRGHVGRMAVAPLECDGANITQDTARLAITGADPHFVGAVLAAGSSQHWMDRRTKGVAVRGINLGDLKRFPVFLPPADLQRQFSAKVEQQERLMKQCSTQATEADALFASIQHRAFSGQL